MSDLPRRSPVIFAVVVAVLYYGLHALFDDIVRIFGWDFRVRSPVEKITLALALSVVLTLLARRTASERKQRDP